MKDHLLFIGKNLIRMLLLLVAVSIAAFILVSVSPIDPLQANIGQAALGSMSAEQIAKLEEYWGVGVPPIERFVSWASDFFRGDMGVSLLYRQPVAKVIAVKLENSLWLMCTCNQKGISLDEFIKSSHPSKQTKNISRNSFRL